MRAVLQFLREEHATTATEYAVMLGAILLVIVAAISVFGSETGGMWGGIHSNLQSAGF